MFAFLDRYSEIVKGQAPLEPAVASVLHPLHHGDADEESDVCNLEWRLEWWTIDDAAKAQRGEKAKSVRDCLPVTQIKIQIQKINTWKCKYK